MKGEPADHEGAIDLWKQQEAIRGHQRPSEAIVPVEAAGGHQRPSEARQSYLWKQQLVEFGLGERRLGMQEDQMD
eukprot:jgi/Chrpa1/26750/Chrysochromulina_OHIO_Genome00022347-RA